LKGDKEVVLKAVAQDGYALRYADESLRKDKEVVLKAVAQDGYALEYADESLRKDKEVVLKAVGKHGYVLMYADEILRKDKEVVLKAVAQEGMALEDADESLKGDKDFVEIASKSNIFIRKYINKGKMTGRQLNELYPGIKLRKKIPENMIEDGFEYQEGINEDTIPFYPSGECEVGGLYCTTERYINDYPSNYFGYSMDIYEVRIPDEAEVYIEGPHKLKADMLEIVRKIN
jgi:hypothetical protein